MNIIGIAGPRRFGKTSLAYSLRSLARQDGFKVIERGFSQTLKQEVAAFLSITLQMDYREALYRLCRDPDFKSAHYRLVQWWSEEYRKKQDPGYLIKKLAEWLERQDETEPGRIYIVPDCLTLDELTFLRGVGAMMILARPADGEDDGIDAHTLFDWDAVIEAAPESPDAEHLAETIWQSVRASLTKDSHYEPPTITDTGAHPDSD